VTDITKVYQGYLNLVTYLEEKFPGCVHIEYNAPPRLIIVSPTTQTTVDTFILPACSKFNALGTTKLICRSDAGYTYISSRDIKASLFILYYVAYRNVMSPRGLQTPQLQKVTYGRPMSLQEGQSTEFLKDWLESITAMAFNNMHYVYVLEDALNTYEQEFASKDEVQELRHWIYEYLVTSPLHRLSTRGPY